MERVTFPPYLNEASRVYTGNRIALYSPEFTSDQGNIHKYDIVTHPGAVVILPYLDNETILLIKNYRVSVDEWLYELPAGVLEDGEMPKTTAERELIEETGYAANKIDEVLTFYSTPGFTNELLFAYIANDLHFVGQDLDETEQIEVYPTLFKDAVSMIKNGEIKDAKSILLILYGDSCSKSKMSLS